VLIKKRETRREPQTVPSDFIDSLQVCLEQECERFNKLLSAIKSSLENLKKAIKGEIIMSSELEEMSVSFINNQVPVLWKSKSYPSLKPLASWFDNLIQRIEFFREWLLIEHGQKPKAYWLSAFFFPQGFLTSVLQNNARTNQIAIDVLGFSFKFIHNGVEEL